MEKKAQPSSSTVKKSLFSSDAIAGGFAGGFARLVTSPLDVLKIRYQLQSYDHPKYKNMFSAVGTIIREEGVWALWKGNLSATYLYVAYAMVQFGVYGVLKRSLTAVPDPSSLYIRRAFADDHHSDSVRSHPSSSQWKALMVFVAGALAGITATAATYPFDLMRTQFALQGKSRIYTSVPSFVAHTVSRDGLRGLYTGLGPAVIGVAPYMGLNFLFYEAVHKYLEGSAVYNTTGAGLRVARDETLLSSAVEAKPSGLSALLNVVKSGAAGGLAGGASKFLVFPLDTIKRRLQSQVLKNTFEYSLAEAVVAAAPHYSGLRGCVASIWRQEGLSGFYRGIVPTTVKSVAATAITFAAYETSRDFVQRLTHTERKNREATL